MKPKSRWPDSTPPKLNLLFIGRVLFFLASLLFWIAPIQSVRGQDITERLARSAERAAEAFNRCDYFLSGWIPFIDKETGLLAQRIGDEPPVWNPHNAAADNFPFMLISAAFTRPDIFGSLLENALTGELVYTIEQGLPFPLNLASRKRQEATLDHLIFGASEYAKDGLVPMLEILGPGVWVERMADLTRNIFRAAPVETPFGLLPSVDAEVNGEMLQVLCRLYWMTGKPEYLEWARRIGDAYCYEVLPGNHGVPAHFWDFNARAGDGRLMLRDHGCEIIGGLTLLYAVERELESDRARSYLPALDRMLRRAVEIGTDSLGMFYNEVDAATGEITRSGISDNWGYDFYSWVTMTIATGDSSYLVPVRRALRNLHCYTGYRWEPRGEGESHDGIADAVEGALLLLSHLPEPGALPWVEHEIGRMFDMQRADGVIEGWWGDGNFARTALMYALYKTRGCRLDPWRSDLRIAAEETETGLRVYLNSEKPWNGRLKFDPPRHELWLGMRTDYPRINAFPEWFTAKSLRLYRVSGLPVGEMISTGNGLIEGLEIRLDGIRPLVIEVGTFDVQH